MKWSYRKSGNMQHVVVIGFDSPCKITDELCMNYKSLMHSNPGNCNFIHVSVYTYPVFTQRSSFNFKRSKFLRL
jgi:hypothetical protein